MKVTSDRSSPSPIAQYAESLTFIYTCSYLSDMTYSYCSFSPAYEGVEEALALNLSLA